MKKIVRGNDFMLRVPVRKIVNGEKERFPLPACEEIEVNLVNAYRRRKMPHTIGVEDDSLLEVSVHSSEMALGAYALEVKGKLFGCSWRSNEYEQLQLVDNNASGDTEFDETDEGEDSVEMDTALVVLAPVTVIDGNFEVLKNEITNGVRDGKWLPLKRGRKSDGTFVDDCVEMGYQSEATGYGSTAMGYNCKASGNTAHAENAGCKALGDNSHAEGNDGTANGNNSHVEGKNCTANGNNSHAEGEHCVARGENSHAEGNECTANRFTSHDEGRECTANGDYSHAEGRYTIASGTCSHAEGGSSTASGNCSHAECSSTASGDYSHAECSSTASGFYSHAEGSHTTASGLGAHTEGLYCTASGWYTHAQGSYNYDDGSFIDIVGIGEFGKKMNASVIYVNRGADGSVIPGSPKHGYQYLLDVGGYKGREIGNAKSVQEVFADLTSRIEALEAKLADTTAEEDKQTN